jgi:DNA-binding transcriptional regulator YiaG
LALEKKLFGGIVNKQLAYMWGVLKGDGSYYLDKREYKNKIYFYKNISLTVKDKDFAIKFKGVIEKFFKRECKIIKTTRNYWMVYIYNVELPTIDLNQLLTASEKIQCAFIQGFVDSEGHVNKSIRQIEITNTSKKFLTLISNIFNHLKIENKIYILYKNHKNWKDCYRIMIQKRESLELFKEKIGFSIKRKNEVLQKILSSYKYDNPSKIYQETLKLIRQGLTRKEIAKRYSISVMTLYNWKYNRHKPMGVK